MVKVPVETVRARAIDELGMALARTRPGVTVSSAGYVRDPSENLLEDIEADLCQGDGNELEEKFRAAHSSSALAVNNFAPFKRRPGSLKLAGISALGAPLRTEMSDGTCGHTAKP
jgi:hypothetical protein